MNAAERRAAWHYRLRGYRILARNAWAGGNELDLVVRRGGTLVFCEVKSKADDGFGGAAARVDREKRRRVRRAAEAWLASRPRLAALDARFDVVSVEAGRLRRLADAF